MEYKKLKPHQIRSNKILITIIKAVINNDMISYHGKTKN